MLKKELMFFIIYLISETSHTQSSNQYFIQDYAREHFDPMYDVAYLKNKKIIYY